MQMQCTESDEKHLRPDRFMFGILIDSWARRRDFQKIESVFEEMVKEYEQDQWVLENFSYLVEKGVQEMFPKIISAAKELNIVRTIGQKVMKEYTFEFQGTYLSQLGIEQPSPDVTQSKFGMLNTLRLTRSLI